MVGYMRRGDATDTAALLTTYVQSRHALYCIIHRQTDRQTDTGVRASLIAAMQPSVVTRLICAKSTILSAQVSRHVAAQCTHSCERPDGPSVETRRA